MKRFTLRPGSQFAALAGLAGLALMTTAARAAVLLASDSLTKQILRFDLATGAALGAFTSGTNLNSPRDMTWGADGHLLVLDGNFTTFTYQVHRFHGSSGAFLGTLIEGGNPNAALTVGPDGNIYLGVGSVIRKHDGATGAFLSNLVTQAGMSIYAVATGPDGLIYATGSLNSTGVVFRYSTTLSVSNHFATGGDPNGPRKPVWDADGHLYTANLNDGRVYRFHGQTGELLGTFADPPGTGHVPALLAPDGRLYTASVWANTIYRHDGLTGANLGSFATNVQSVALQMMPFPPVPARGPAVSNGVFRVKYLAAPHSACTVVTRSNLTTSPWQTWTNTRASAAGFLEIHSPATAAPQRYFRAGLAP